MRRLGLLFGVCCTLLVAGVAAEQQDSGTPDPLRLDKYGGYEDITVPGGATGFFRIEKLGDRWMFVTPQGHPYWLLAVYGLDITDGGNRYVEAITKKYPGTPEWGYRWEWAGNSLRRIKSWGFNAVGEYSSRYMLPVGTYGHPSGNPEKLPFLGILNASWYSKLPNSHISEPVKDIIAGTAPGVYTGWRGQFPDIFDPKFEEFVSSKVADNSPQFFTDPPEQSPWIIGTTLDDADYTYGFGPHPDVVPDHYHSHLGWIVAVTAPTQQKNTQLGISYTDTIVYTKHAFRDFLRHKYKTLEALNTAWGSRYTSWDSNGGWPGGSGVLDESGQHPWMGRDFDRLGDVAAQVSTDLDAFLEVIADKYFSALASALRRRDPNHLVFGPAAIGAGARPQVLRAAGRHLDALQVWVSPDRLDLLKRTYEISGLPIFVWSTFMAQADSPLRGQRGWGPTYDFPSQEARGKRYAEYLHQLIALQASDGTYPVIGIDWWAWCDKVVGGEANNFGLVTIRDNAYDGKEAVKARGADPWGYPAGGEEGDYGDFLSRVTEVNHSVKAMILDSRHSSRHLSPLKEFRVVRQESTEVTARGQEP